MMEFGDALRRMPSARVVVLPVHFLGISRFVRSSAKRGCARRFQLPPLPKFATFSLARH